jgi:cytochrome c553
VLLSAEPSSNPAHGARRAAHALALGGRAASLFLAVACCSLLLNGARSNSATADEPAVAAVFGGEIKPILTAKCGACHGADDPSGRVDFSRIGDQPSILRSRKLWRKAIAQLEAGTMPPQDEEPLTPDERNRLLAWLRPAAAAVDCANPANRDPGPALVRRLSLAEYNNTVRDLFGFEFNAADAVGMSDDAGAGNSFGNLAAALAMPPTLVDKYFAAADKVLDRLFCAELSSSIDGNIEERARIARETMFGVKSRAWSKPDAAVGPPEGVAPREAARQIARQFVRRAWRRSVESDEIEQLLKLYDLADRNGESYPRCVRLMLKGVLVSPNFLFRIEADGAPDGSQPVRRVDDHELAVRLSYFIWSSMPDDQLIELADQRLLTAPGPSNVAVKLSGKLIGVPNGNSPSSAERAFDGDSWTVYESNVSEGSWLGLDLGEPRVIKRVRYAGRPGDPRRMLNGKFQGSSTADFSADVVELASVDQPPENERYGALDVSAPQAVRYVRYLVPKEGWGNVAELEFWGLTPGTVLEQQVKRMLSDLKSRALTENFAANWLQIRNVALARPSTEFFPDYTPDVRKALYDETATFFDKLREEDRSLLEMLDADYTYLNEELAKFYKLPAVSGKEMRRVSLAPDSHRGGLLGMGSILSLTSHTSRTSPTLRGKWILDVLFGAPPPPPPAGVSVLKDEAEKGKEPQTFREKMSRHSADPACAACHTKMDPLGYALENYNAVGIWREADGARPLDTSGELPGGEKINGAGQLKELIHKRQDQFVTNLAEQMLVYALGRELDYYDDCPLDEIKGSLVRGEYRFSALVMAITASYPFQQRRAAEATGASAVISGSNP